MLPEPPCHRPLLGAVGAPRVQPATPAPVLPSMPLRKKLRRPEAHLLAAALSLLLCSLFAASWLTERSAFIATTPVPSPRTIAPPGTPGYGQRYERIERHLMLGRGLLILHTMPVHTEGPFQHARADLNSIYLARAVVYDDVSPWTSFRAQLNPGPAGPQIYLPLWLPTALSLLLTAYLIRRRLRRIPPGHCRCGYRLEGLPADSACPECGRTPRAPGLAMSAPPA